MVDIDAFMGGSRGVGCPGRDQSIRIQPWATENDHVAMEFTTRDGCFDDSKEEWKVSEQR